MDKELVLPKCGVLPLRNMEASKLGDITKPWVGDLGMGGADCAVDGITGGLITTTSATWPFEVAGTGERGEFGLDMEAAPVWETAS